MVNPDSGAIISAQPRDPRALAEHICSDAFGANAEVDIAAIPNARHLMFRVVTGDNQYALKMICGEHAAWHAEILARKLLGDPAVPRIAFSGKHNVDVDFVFMEWVDGARHFGKPDFFDYFEPHLRVISDRFGRELALPIQDALRPIATYVEAHQKLAISHGDLQPKNLIIPKLRDGLNLIDWEFISFSPMWADLSQLLRHAPNKQIEGELESGYSSVQPMPINWRVFARAYDLIRICTGLSHPSALRGSDIENWGRFVRDLVRSVKHGGVHTTYESTSFLR